MAKQRGFSGKIEQEKQERRARRTAQSEKYAGKRWEQKGAAGGRKPSDGRDGRDGGDGGDGGNGRSIGNGRDGGGHSGGNARKERDGAGREAFAGRKPSATRAQHEARPAEPPAAQPAQAYADEPPYFLMGRNTVREALKSGRSVDRLLVVKERDGSLGEIVRLARDNNVLIREVDRQKLDDMCMPFGHGGRPGNHQGVVALVPDVEYSSIPEMLEEARARGEQPFVIVLQEILDPHNLGSILRSAACAGAHGVVIPKRRAASVTSAVAKASAGAVEYVKVARVANIANTLNELKKAGLWIAGADMAGEPMDRVDLAGPLALVIGSEGEGLGRLVRETCDHLVRIPMQGPIDSLNASVAAAVLMFEKRRQDGRAAGGSW